MPGVAGFVSRLIPMDSDALRGRIDELLVQARRDPGSVPYGVTALEAIAAGLGNVAGNYVQHERDQYLRWLELRAQEQGGAWAAAVQTGEDALPTSDQRERIAWQWIRRHAAPFPVGQGCLELGAGMPGVALTDLLPLMGDEYAFELEPHGKRGGALLFMGKTIGRRYLSAGGWIGTRLEWVPDGARVEPIPVPRRSISKADQAAARRWWREVHGLPTGAGRHAGATFWTPARISDNLLAYVQEHHAPPKDRETFVEWAHAREGMTIAIGGLQTTGKRWTRTLGVGWAPIRDEVATPTGAVLVVEDADGRGA